MAYWYNVKTDQVETDENRSPDADVLGPYETRQAAERALATSKQRNDTQDARDAAWNGDDQTPS
jgi:hypothetical protein